MSPTVENASESDPGNASGNAANAAAPLRRAMETIRSLRAQLDAVRSTQRVAVVGAGLRAPGGIADRETYWQALLAGRELTGELPDQRRPAGDWDGLLSRGGYLDDVLGFDADFFGISPREARNLDPQHRLLLEVAWEAFEDAAIPPAAVAARAGVFIGITGQDYRTWATDDPSPSWLIGNGHCFSAGRIAHTLGLQGPVLAIDTACSSSLVAVHQACRALAAGDCDVAAAGGVNLVLSPRSTAEIQRTSALSPDGRCRPFDARANGFVRGEGCGVLVLKRLADAERDGDRILAVIEGTGVNHDGNSTGFTAPNMLAQARLIESVLETAGLTASDIGYLEAHGTGTPLGDPIELEAARMALGTTGRTWHVGSVKANLGHTEAAAGVLGLLKVVLCLQHRQIPPQARFETLNPRIKLGDGLTVPREAVRWEPSAGRCAGVSSFGMSGTNAHAVLSSYEHTPYEYTGGPAPAGGFLVSAHTESALRTLAAHYSDRLQDVGYPEFAHTATHGRTRLRHAAWIKADGAQEAREALTALAAGAEDGRIQLLDPDDPLPETVADTGRAVVSLPGYPWERRIHSIRPVPTA
ncbi:beta-ketoacyl synthase N-terminal-like domain-containing protein [Streptomyces sp. NPDC057136]|uniref:beta-ketoacyl synthase N-terminal-like domain-containing protein n=1 Tax=Streptomyces sp. NPDC057136 TaxID=3346029 RepID=UPI003630DABC